MSKNISKNRAWLIWGVAALFYLYELVLRVSPSVMTDDLMITFNATSTMLGVLVSFYYYAYTILQLPCGIILDKLGPRNLLGLSALLCVIGSALFAGVDKIHIAQVGRFLVGAGSACAFISCLQIAADLFPKKHFVLLAGATNMMGTLGGFLGGFPVAKAVNTFGWQNTTYVLAAIGCLIFASIFIFTPKSIKIRKEEKVYVSIFQTFGGLFRNSQIMLSGIIASFMYLPVSAFAELWAVPFFMKKYNINNENASVASAFIFIGVAIGSVLLAIFTRKIRSYMKTIRLASIGTALLFIPIIFWASNIYISFVLVFLIGFLTGAQPISFTCAKNNASSEISGTTLALTNCIVMLIGSIFQPFFGFLLDIFWSGAIGENGVRSYDISCYKKAMLIIPIALIISYILSLFVKETITLEND